jgi:hypothetical protein
MNNIQDNEKVEKEQEEREKIIDEEKVEEFKYLPLSRLIPYVPPIFH